MTATEGYLAETAEIGTTVRISPDAKAESLQILVNDDDLVSILLPPPPHLPLSEAWNASGYVSIYPYR